MKLHFPNGDVVERPLNGKLKSLSRGRSRPTSVEFSASELFEVYLALNVTNDDNRYLREWVRNSLFPSLNFRRVGE